MRQGASAARRGARGGGIRAARMALVVLVVLAALVMLAGCATATGSGGAGGGGAQAAREPTATPTAELRVAALAQRAAGGLSVRSVVTTFGGGGADASVVTLTAMVGGAVPGTAAEIAASQERVKTICFRMERALWTSGMPLREVVVTVVGPIYDDYADLTTGPYGAADLKAATATGLNWTSISPDAAWDTYAVWLRPAYRSKVLGQ